MGGDVVIGPDLARLAFSGYSVLDADAEHRLRAIRSYMRQLHNDSFASGSTARRVGTYHRAPRLIPRASPCDPYRGRWWALRLTRGGVGALPSQAAPPQAALTEREIEFLRLVATGRKTREIARTVHLAERTVKHYLELICEKLGAENRSHAAALAVQRGLIRIDDR